jgi:hypothetical protein
MHEINAFDNEFVILFIFHKQNVIPDVVRMLCEDKNTGRYQLFDWILYCKANAGECCPYWNKAVAEILCENGGYFILISMWRTARQEQMQELTIYEGNHYTKYDRDDDIKSIDDLLYIFLAVHHLFYIVTPIGN